MDDIIILDDVISKQYQQLIIDNVINEKNFPWYYTSTITRNQDFKDSDDDSYGFSHQFFSYDSGSNSYITNMLIPLLYEACSKIDYEITNFLAGRCFMTFPVAGRELSSNAYHIDLPGMDHMVCLYYVNDSSGDTVISSVKEGDISDIKSAKVEDIPILKTITPKQGRCVFFDGKRYHASGIPEKGKRCVINFDFK